MWKSFTKTLHPHFTLTYTTLYCIPTNNTSQAGSDCNQEKQLAREGEVFVQLLDCSALQWCTWSGNFWLDLSCISSFQKEKSVNQSFLKENSKHCLFAFNCNLILLSISKILISPLDFVLLFSTVFFSIAFFSSLPSGLILRRKTPPGEWKPRRTMRWQRDW